MHPDEELFDRPQAATFCRLAVGTMNKKRLNGDGPRFIKLGRRVLYSRQDLLAYIHGNRRNSTSDPGVAPLASQK